MEIIKIKISKGQYISEIFDDLWTNSIYYKELTNIGFTTKEMEALRHSIIFQPNVPVIKGKRKRGILGVYEGVTIEKIISYLSGKTKYKKIFVTPESFFKVKEAADYLKINIYDTFFCLFDECDRIIKDSGYRKAITLPMDDFFMFKNKCFASATALEPSDPRFEEQQFKKVVIEPDFDYSKDLSLITTNNVFLSLQKVIHEIEAPNICIFLNSTKLISSYIKKLDILEKSHIFCSRESSYTLKLAKFKNVSDSLNGFLINNFFTSRFYSAVDIYMETKPVVILVTDLVNAPHSMIDPFTDAIQAVGRFRNGFDKLIHITNIDSDLTSMSRSEVRAYLNGCEMSYNDIKALRNSATNRGSIETLDEVLRLIPYAKYLNTDGTKNFFMEDNTFHEEVVKGCYRSSKDLINAYTNKHFNVNHKNDRFPLDDFAEQNLKSGISMQTIVKEIVRSLDSINDNSIMFTIDNRDTVIKELTKSYPVIVEAYNILGGDELLRNGYSMNQIRKALRRKRESGEKTRFEFLQSLNDTFNVNDKFSADLLLDNLAFLIKKHSLSLKPTIKLMEEYFKLSPRTTIERTSNGLEVKGYKILGSKFNMDS